MVDILLITIDELYPALYDEKSDLLINLALDNLTLDNLLIYLIL